MTTTQRLSILNVAYLQAHQLQLTFNNGAIALVDLESELHGEIFEPLRAIDFFQQVQVNPETQTIEWPNGADFAPEFLYEISQNLDRHQHSVTPSNYRLILQDGLYQIRQIHYDETGKIIACSAEAIQLIGKTREDLQNILQAFQTALQNPVLLPENLPTILCPARDELHRQENSLFGDPV